MGCSLPPVDTAMPDGVSRSGIGCRIKYRILNAVIPAQAGIHNRDIVG